jgi:hypothetical protein
MVTSHSINLTDQEQRVIELSVVSSYPKKDYSQYTTTEMNLSYLTLKKRMRKKDRNLPLKGIC